METYIFKEKYESEKNNVKDNNIDEITIIYKNKKINNINEKIKNNIKNKLGEEMSKNKLFGERFVRNNKNNCKIVINGKEKELVSFYDIERLEENVILEIKLKGINKIKNMSYMFCGCLSLLSLQDISKLKTDNIIDLACLFSGCISLTELPDISKWNTNNVTDIGCIFHGCSSLTKLPDISKWNTNNVTNIGCIFYGCSSLIELPDISKWNINNVTIMVGIFEG